MSADMLKPEGEGRRPWCVQTSFNVETLRDMFSQGISGKWLSSVCIN